MNKNNDDVVKTRTVKDVLIPVDAPTHSLLVIDKYIKVFNYLYPIALNISNKHKILKEELLKTLIEHVKFTEEAVKANSRSKVYAIDTNLAYIKDLLMIMASDKIRLISQHQQMTASKLMEEVGGIIGKWKNKVK